MRGIIRCCVFVCVESSSVLDYGTRMRVYDLLLFYVCDVLACTLHTGVFRAPPPRNVPSVLAYGFFPDRSVLTKGGWVFTRDQCV